MCEVCGSDSKPCRCDYAQDDYGACQLILKQLYAYGREGYGIKDLLIILCKASAHFLANHLNDEQFERYVNLMKDYYISYKENELKKEK